AERAGERDRVGERLDAGDVDGGELLHVDEDRVELAGEAIALVPVEGEAREGRRGLDLLGGDLHGSRNLRATRARLNPRRSPERTRRRSSRRRGKRGQASAVNEANSCSAPFRRWPSAIAAALSASCDWIARRSSFSCLRTAATGGLKATKNAL